MNESSEGTTKRKRGRPKGSKAQGSGEWKPIFLAAMKNLPVVRVACDKAGISRAEAYRTRTRDPKFATAWEEAKEDGIDVLEASLHIRAREKDTIASIFLLKNLRPNVFGENVNVNVQGSLSIEEVANARKTLNAKLKQISNVVAPGERLITD